LSETTAVKWLEHQEKEEDKEEEKKKKKSRSERDNGT
jgi:hypothetical protein